MSQTPHWALAGLVFVFVGPLLGHSWSEGEAPPARHVPRTPPTKQELDRRLAQRHFGLGAVHERNNRLVEAIRAYEEAERLDPSSAAIPRALFGLYFALDKVDEGVKACQKVLKLEPEDCQTAYHYARQLRGLERRKEAIAILEQATRSARLKEKVDLAAQLWFDLGLMQEQEKAWDRADKAFGQVVELFESPNGLIQTGRFTREEINTQAAETLERKGQVCLKAGRIDAAIKAFESAKQKDSLRAPRLAFNLAQVHRDQGRYREALAQLETYLLSQPQGTEGYEMRITLLGKLDRQGDVVKTLEASCDRDPNHTGLKLLLAREYRKAERITEAASLYTRVLETHVAPEVYRGLFELWHAQGPKGISNILNMIDPVLDRAMGDGKDRAGSPSDARRARAMLGALREDPAVVRAILPVAILYAEARKLKLATSGVLGTLAARTRQLAQAEKLYRTCLDRPGGLGLLEHEVYFGLLSVLRAQHKHREIVEICKRGLKTAHQTNRVLFHRALVSAYQAMENHKAAVAAADLAVTEAGKAELLGSKRLRIHALLQADQHAKALAECQEMLKVYNHGGELRDVRYTLSSVLQAMGKHDEAEEQLQLILRSDSNDATANNDLGYLWADRNKKLEEAERLIRKAIELDRQQRNSGTAIDTDSDKDNAAYVDSLGWVLFRRGKLEEARQELEKATTLPQGDEDPVVWDHLGDVYYRLKQSTRAVENWKKALSCYEMGTRRKTDNRYREIQEKIRHVSP